MSGWDNNQEIPKDTKPAKKSLKDRLKKRKQEKKEEEKDQVELTPEQIEEQKEAAQYLQHFVNHLQQGELKYKYMRGKEYIKHGGQYEDGTFQDNLGNIIGILKSYQYIYDGVIYDERVYPKNSWSEEKQKEYERKRKEEEKKKKQQELEQLKEKKTELLQNKLENKKEESKQRRKYEINKITDLQAKEQEKLQKGGYFQVDCERDPINLVFIGHVDAGKSTLSGRILIDCKEIDEKTLKALEEEAKKKGMEGWFMAYAMDLSEDERQKGKTVETGKAFFQLSKRRFTLLDAPGHKNYVPNMIAGACQSDMACLIISSKQGEFESGFEKGGQTQEHVQLIRALGVQNLVCVVTKMDTNNWSEDRYNQIVTEMKPWLEKQCGFNSIKFIPVNAFDSQGISQRVDSGICKWYNGESLFEYLNTVDIPKRNKEGDIRIPILDVQREDGKVMVYGKIESGNITEGTVCTSMPSDVDFEIVEIFDAKDRKLAYAAAGENVKLRIKNAEENDLQRGNVICQTDKICGVAYEFLAEIQVLEMPENKPVMSSGYNGVLHINTAVDEIDITEVQAVYDKTVAKFVKSPILKSGERGIVKIQTSSKICLEKEEVLPVLSKFAIRDENLTIAYGHIKKYKPVIKA